MHDIQGFSLTRVHPPFVKANHLPLFFKMSLSMFLLTESGFEHFGNFLRWSSWFLASCIEKVIVTIIPKQGAISFELSLFMIDLNWTIISGQIEVHCVHVPTIR